MEEGLPPPRQPTARHHAADCRCDSCILYYTWADGCHLKKQVKAIKEALNLSTTETFDETLQQFRRAKEVVRECHEDTIATIEGDIERIRNLLETVRSRVERIEERQLAATSGSKWKRPGAAEEEPTLHELFEWFGQLERRIYKATFKWPDEKPSYDDYEEVDRAYLALRSVVEEILA